MDCFSNIKIIFTVKRILQNFKNCTVQFITMKRILTFFLWIQSINWQALLKVPMGFSCVREP